MVHIRLERSGVYLLMRVFFVRRRCPSERQRPVGRVRAQRQRQGVARHVQRTQRIPMVFWTV